MPIYTVTALIDLDSDDFLVAGVQEGQHPAVDVDPPDSQVQQTWGRWCDFVAADDPEKAEALAEALYRYQQHGEGSLEFAAESENSDALVAPSQTWPGHFWWVTPNGQGWSVNLWTRQGTAGFALLDQPTVEAATVAAQVQEDKQAPLCGCGARHWSCTFGVVR